ncbi:T9SS type A sorting domain-containing protein [Flavobacteriales bacterium]|nr:T9SS type A sorting domain-containing protein [Flavobacteriales bacterium]
MLTFFNANATHIMGGEITWECIKDPTDPNVGLYIFKMKIYRDCDGTTLSTFSQTLDVWNHPSVTQIPVDWVISADISPNCDVTNSGNAALDCISNPVGAVEEYIYESQPIALPGIPPANGWHFTWDSCCRNGAISNLILSSTTSPSEGFTLRASMFPYLDASGNAIPALPCFDSSPKFNESPQTIICTGYPFAYTHNASDIELDSIVYDWDVPMDDMAFGQPYNPPVNPVPLAFVAGYSFNNPLPGGVVLDAQTGEISYNSNISGNFASVIRVDAFKCGQLVASIFREIQAVLISCPTLQPLNTINLPPIVSPPFPAPTPYYAIVSAGDLVSFNITATDNDLYGGTVSQDVTLEITGGQIADDYVTNTLCDNPPCATFVNTSGLAPPITGLQMVEGIFEWQTACSHVATDAGCGITSNIYTFAVKAFDDFCPANAITIATITIEVTAADSLPAPDFDCAWEDENGAIVFNWNHAAGSSSSTEYHIHAASNIGGPYSVVADVFYPSNDFTTALSSLPSGSKYFFLTSESTCADNSVTSDTISPIRFSVSSLDVNCWDDTDGIISIGVDDYINVLQYSFAIDGVINTNSFPLDTVFSGVSAGSHVITVDDVTSGCVIDIPVEISAPGFPLQALISSQTLNLCFDDTTSIAIGSSAGGTPGYSYEWFEFGNPVSFSTNDTAFGLGAGSYFLEVMDANGCDTFTSVNVIEPQTALGGSPQIFGVSCKGDASGMLVGDATGSWAPYRYEWFDMSGNLLQSTPTGSPVSERDTLFDLLAGDYVLKIFDAQGCEVEYVLNVPEPSVALAIDSMILIDDIACYGDSVGRAMLSVSGGQPNYYYEWDNGETTLVAEELTSGWHSVLLTDDWGCKLVDSVFIPENTLIVSDLVVDTTVSCYGFSDGQASISTVGGSSFLYTYYWSTSQTTLNANVDVAIGLSYGSYYVTTRDDLGCEVVDTVFISEPEPLSMEAMELDWIDCYNDATGEGVAVAVGGTAPYSFSWDNGTWTSNQGDTLATLTKGLHTVVVTDVRGCTAEDTITIHNPDSLYIVIDESQTVLPYCVGVNTASLSAVATGGTGSYSYVWNDNPALAQTTTTASALLADNYYNTVDSSYTITVTDDKGCTASVTTDTLQNFVETMDADTILISQYYSGTTDANEVSCFGYNDGEVSVSVWAGHGPYTYAWSGINPPNFTANTATISNLYAGVYSVTIRDTNDCMINRGVELIQPDMLTFNTSVVIDESCYGACDGEIVVDSIAGGVAGYSAQLTDNVTAITTAHAIIGSSITAVCSGDYTVALIDVNSCPSVVIAGGIDQQLVGTPEVTEANIGVVNGEVCYGASTGELAVLNPNMNTGYTYSWENANNPGQSIATTTTIASLSAGTYVLLADYNNTLGCTSEATFTITSMPMLEITYHTVSDVLCNGGSTGEVMVVPSLDVVNPTYSWSNGSNTSTASNLQVGTHILTMTDINGCTQDFSYVVNEPSAVVVNVTATQTYILNANASGGTPPYSYSWREQSNSNTSLGSQATYTVGSNGTYYVVVTDDNGCEETSQVTTYNEGTTGLVNASATNIELNIYPNPFKDATTVDFGRVIKEATITVVDVYGKLIETHKLENQDTYIIKRNTKASGVYFMEIEIEREKSMIQKLIIE